MEHIAQVWVILLIVKNPAVWHRVVVGNAEHQWGGSCRSSLQAKITQQISISGYPKGFTVWH